MGDAGSHRQDLWGHDHLSRDFYRHRGVIMFTYYYVEHVKNTPYEIRMGVICYPKTGEVRYKDGLPFGMAFGANCRGGKLRYTVPPTQGPFIHMYPPDP